MKKQLDINSTELVDARLTLKNWLSSFTGKTIPDIENIFGKDNLQEDEWLEEDEDGVVVEYECHDYNLEFYVINDEIVAVNYIAFSS